MKSCKQCDKKLRSDYQLNICKQCLSTCECGAKKDWRATRCRSCSSRILATKQWASPKVRSRMIAALQIAAVIRTGKHIKPRKPCSIEGCEKVADARGWCRMHYVRWQTHGSPLVGGWPDAEQFFWQNVDKNGPIHPILKTACWLWTASKNELGYGVITVEGKRTRAHRYSYFLAHGRWPEPHCLHHCDHPPCVRPDHLHEGNPQANATDKVSRGRQPKGEKVGTAKLSDADERIVRQLLSEGVYQKDIAARFGVDQSTISNIKTGKIRKYVGAS